MAEPKVDYLSKANVVVDQSLESTRRIRQMAEETVDCAVKTAEELSIQGEQLNKIEGQLDTINHDIKEAEKSLKNMEKFMGWFKMPKFGKKKDKLEKPNDDLWKNKAGGDNGEKQVKKSSSRGGGGQLQAQQQPASGPMINRITNDDREDEMEENLSAVDGILATLKNAALDIGDEIDSQNQVLDRLGGKIDDTDLRIKNANTRTQKLLNK